MTALMLFSKGFLTSCHADGPPSAIKVTGGRLQVTGSNEPSFRYNGNAAHPGRKPDVPHYSGSSGYVSTNSVIGGIQGDPPQQWQAYVRLSAKYGAERNWKWTVLRYPAVIGNTPNVNLYPSGSMSGARRDLPDHLVTIMCHPGSDSSVSFNYNIIYHLAYENAVKDPNSQNKSHTGYNTITPDHVSPELDQTGNEVSAKTGVVTLYYRSATYWVVGFANGLNIFNKIVIGAAADAVDNPLAAAAEGVADLSVDDLIDKAKEKQYNLSPVDCGATFRAGLDAPANYANEYDPPVESYYFDATGNLHTLPVDIGHYNVTSAKVRVEENLNYMVSEHYGPNGYIGPDYEVIADPTGTRLPSLGFTERGKE